MTSPIEAEKEIIATDTAAETRTRPNSFASFIEGNTQEFTEFAASTREVRAIMKAWEAAFVPINQGLMDELRGFPVHEKKKAEMARHYRAAALNFEPEGQSEQLEEIETDDPDDIEARGITLSETLSMPVRALTGRGMAGRIDAVRAFTKIPGDHVGVLERIIPQASSKVIGFNRDFCRAMSGPYEHYASLSADLGDKTRDLMMSNYQVLVDMFDFLSARNNGQAKTTIAAFFRDLGELDTYDRKNGETSFTTAIRTEWQKRLRNSFDGVVFERFWEDATKPSKPQGFVDLVQFGGLLVVANSGGELREPTTHEIQQAISKLPMARWPKPLVDAYIQFANQDAARLTEGIRNQILRNFPDGTSGTIFLAETDGGGSTKKKHTRDNGGQLPTAPEEPAFEPEAAIARLGLGLLKQDVSPHNNSSHYVVPVSDADINSQITTLAGVGATQDMRADLEALLQKLRDPLVAYGPAARRINGDRKSVTVDHHSITLRSLKPSLVSDVSFQDPETVQTRILYGVEDDRVLIYGVYSCHDDYQDALKG